VQRNYGDTDITHKALEHASTKTFLDPAPGSDQPAVMRDGWVAYVMDMKLAPSYENHPYKTVRPQAVSPATIDQRVRTHVLEQCAHRRGVGDVSMHEAIALVAGDAGEGIEIGGVGELVEIDDRPGRGSNQMAANG
jgi:hypothetical protein